MYFLQPACTKPFVSFSCLVRNLALKVIVRFYSAADVEIKRFVNIKNFVPKPGFAPAAAWKLTADGFVQAVRIPSARNLSSIYN